MPSEQVTTTPGLPPELDLPEVRAALAQFDRTATQNLFDTRLSINIGYVERLNLSHTKVEGEGNLVGVALDSEQRGFSLVSPQQNENLMAPSDKSKKTPPEIIATATEGSKQKDFNAESGRIRASAGGKSTQQGFRTGKSAASSDDLKPWYRNSTIIGAIIAGLFALGAAYIGAAHFWTKKDEPPARGIDAKQEAGAPADRNEQPVSPEGGQEAPTRPGPSGR
ncbi:hypothetical protein [Corallococcus sp. AB045]|uniref:hypothetical protein n=1 Tax=Corallococcus sp. AB045 TaxID=2316719 RepID=UPI0011C46B0E|nr:hypothetical protein [Corallococcus sp. AB045]